VTQLVILVNISNVLQSFDISLQDVYPYKLQFILTKMS